MKKLLLLFILLIPFISYADDSNDYCSNSNLKIQNLLKANDSKQIYSYLSDSYIYYYNKCGNTDNLKLLIDKYISLINSDSNNVRFYDNMYLLHILRPFLNDAQYYSFKKNAVVKYVKHDKEFLLYDYLPDIYKIDISKYQAEEYNNLLTDEIGKNLIRYYKVDTKKFCGGDGEGYFGCSYKYVYNKPLKLSGTLTVSNLYNQENTDHPNYFKASFKADNLDIDFSKLFVVPINYKLNTQIPANYLHTGAVGEITFNVDFILDKDSFIDIGFSPFGDISAIYVKDLNINSVKNIKYYDESFINNYKFKGVIEPYKVSSDDSYVNMRDKPNGKVIHKFKLNSTSKSIVYFYRGYIEPNPGYRIDAMGVVPSNYLYNYYRILKFSKSVVNDWYFVSYFPKGSNKPVFGYIHSSQLSYYSTDDSDNSDSDDDYFYTIDGFHSFEIDNEYLDSLENIDSLSYSDIFEIFHKMYDSNYNFSRVSYYNNKLQLLVNKYVSYLLSSNFIMRNNEEGMSYDIFFVNIFLYYISDSDYYKILDKYSKDIVIYDNLFNKNRSLTCSNAIKSVISPKYISYFKYDDKSCDYIEDYNLDNFNKLFYGVYNADKLFKEMKSRHNLHNFNSFNQVKINGKVIVDSKNHDISFVFNDFLLMDNVSIYPLNYSIDKSAYSNLIKKGYLGKVSFDAELTLSKNTLLIHSKDNKLFVDNIHIKSAKDISYYDIDDYKPSDYLDFLIIHYKVSHRKGAVLLDYPNGKTIANLKKGSVVYFVYYDIDKLWDNLFDFYGYGVLDYAGNNNLGKYYRVIYFPEGVIDGSIAISGYIDSSLLKKDEK